jgi:hypothetical protein
VVDLVYDPVGGVAKGQLTPVTPQVRPMSEAAELLNDFLDRKITGKVALIPSS